MAWQPYVFKKPHTSYKMLHELAREIRGVEKKRGKKLSVSNYTAIFDRWVLASRQFLRPRHDYFIEFLAKLDCVTVPKGETGRRLEQAFETSGRHDRREHPKRGVRDFPV